MGKVSAAQHILRVMSRYQKQARIVLQLASAVAFAELVQLLLAEALDRFHFLRIIVRRQHGRSRPDGENDAEAESQTPFLRAYP
jgi:hypothetical protein